MTTATTTQSPVVKHQNTVLFNIGAKGGTGKTLWMVHLLKMLTMIGVLFRAFDFEPVSGTGLGRMFKAVSKSSLGKVDERIADLDSVLNQATKRDANPSLTLVDMPSNAGDAFLEWAKVINWNSLSNYGVRVIFVLVLSDDADSFDCARRWIVHTGKAVQYVVIYNHGRGQNFLAFRDSRQGIDFLAEHQPLEIHFPRLPDYLITPARNAGYTLFDAVNEETSQIIVPGIPDEFMDRQRISKTCEEIKLSLHPLLDFLTK